MTLPPEVAELVTALAAQPKVLLASDFDGTLAPFVVDPMDARPAPGATAALDAAAALAGVTVALVSGRQLDVLRRLAGDDARFVYLGSHGGESSLADETALDPEQRSTLARIEAALDAVAAAHPGARVEHKLAARALHTRGMPEDAETAALEAALEATEGLGGHVLRGKGVVEVAVLTADKGSALRALAAHLGVDATLYVGDDVTDEHAFTALSPADGDVTVKVGDGDTAAIARVADTAAVVALLEAFVAARSAH